MPFRHAHRATRCFLLLLHGAAAAFAFAEFGQVHGLPNLAVSSIAFDSRGFLLAGTDRGLYRLEGDRFRIFGAGLKGDVIRAIATPADGSVWIMARDQLWRGVAGEFLPVDTGPHRIRASPGGLAPDLRGNVYAAAEDGVLICSAKATCGWIAVGDKPEALAVSGENLWIAGRKVWRASRGRAAEVIIEASEGVTWAAAMAAPDGRVWFRSERGLAVWEPSRSAIRRVSRPEPVISQFLGLAALGGGSIAAASGDSLWIWSPSGSAEWKRWPGAAALQSGTISALTADANGDPWAGIDGAGIRRFAGARDWASWNRSNGLANDNVRVIHRDRRGRIWIGAGSHLYEWEPSGPGWSDGRWVPRLERVWDPGDPVNAIEDDPENRLWVGLDSGEVIRWDAAGGEKVRTRLRDSVVGLRSSGTEIVAVTERGPHSSDRSKLNFEPEEVDGPSRRIYSLGRTASGDLYAAGMGLLIRTGKRWRQASRALAGERLRRAALGPAGSIWAALHQPRGVALWDRAGTVTHYDSTNALRSDRASFLDIDGRGRVWVGSDSGIHMFDGKWWRAWDQSDGLVWNHTNSRAFADGGDGTVWIGTARGVSRFRPSESGPPELPLTITRIAPRPPGGDFALEATAPPGQRTVEIDFAVPVYSSPGRIEYQYRARSISRNWMPAESPSIRLGLLAPGLHEIEVRARMDFGPWSHSKQPVRVRVEPEWWETGGARALAALSFLLLMLGIVTWKTRAGIARERRLEALVEERTRDLARARDEAVSASQAKAAFLAKMSHEIRTPLNGVIGTIGLLRDTMPDPGRKDLAALAMSSAENLLSVIGGVLDFSKIESGRMTVERVCFRLRDTAVESVSLLKARAAAKGIGLDCAIAPGVPEWVLSDPLRIRQILLNLVSNAVKFTEQGAVRILVETAGLDGDRTRVRFSVADTGIGIPQAARAKLFQPFTQVDDSTTRLYGGTGLGLVIARQLCELMGGEIGFESAEGKGSTFWFELPLESAAAPVTPPHAEASVEGPAPRILLAEDNKSNQRVAASMLEVLGLGCELAANGREALERLSREDFDIVLLDCQMPLVDGYEVARRIRAGETRNSAIRIVALTANALPGDREECMRAGMDDYLAKPLNPSALENAIRPAPGRV